MSTDSGSNAKMSSVHQFDLIDEPRGEDLAALLALSLASCKQFSLVRRSEIEFSPSAVKLLEALRAGIIGEREVTEWPGTRLYGGSALLYEFKLTRTTASMLSAAADGLYDWQQPSRLEDLAIFRSPGEPWLVTIAHERDGYLLLTSEEQKALAESYPSLRAMLKQRS